jgi:hypothetical protein
MRPNSGCDLVMCPRSVTIAFPALISSPGADHDRHDAYETVAAGQSISVLAVLQMGDATHSLAVTSNSAAVNTRSRGG